MASFCCGENLKSKLLRMRVLHLEVRLCKNTGEFGCSVGAMFEWVQVSQDLLQELHIVLPHWRQMYLLQALLLLLTHATHQGGKAKHAHVNTCTCVSPSYRWTLHDAFEVDEIQVIGCGGAGSAFAHCIYHLGSYTIHTHTHTMKRARNNK